MDEEKYMYIFDSRNWYTSVIAKTCDEGMNYAKEHLTNMRRTDQIESLKFMERTPLPFDYECGPVMSMLH